MVLPLPASKPLKWMFEGATYGGWILDSLVSCSPKSWQGRCWKGVLLVRPFAPGSGGTWRHRAPQGDNPKWFVTVSVELTHQGVRTPRRSSGSEKNTLEVGINHLALLLQMLEISIVVTPLAKTAARIPCTARLDHPALCSIRPKSLLLSPWIPLVLLKKEVFHKGSLQLLDFHTWGIFLVAFGILSSS
jgi:hypothetical protein